MHVMNMGLTDYAKHHVKGAAFKMVAGKDGTITRFRYEFADGSLNEELVQQRIPYGSYVTVFFCLADSTGVPILASMWTPDEISSHFDNLSDDDGWRDNLVRQPVELMAALREFEKAASAVIPPPSSDAKLLALRGNLIHEEYKELCDAFPTADNLSNKDTRATFLKECADLIYVIAGACYTLNLDIDTAFMRVHKSNMTKDFSNKNGIGKVQKGTNYKAPDLKDLV